MGMVIGGRSAEKNILLWLGDLEDVSGHLYMDISISDSQMTW